MVEPTISEVERLAEVVTEACAQLAEPPPSHTLARAILVAGYRFVDPDEAHVIDLREDGWTISHPLACRVTGLFECEVNRAAVAQLTEPPPLSPSRYKVGLEDGELVFRGRVTGGRDD
jgi:hypothetical protein